MTKEQLVAFYTMELDRIEAELDSAERAAINNITPEAIAKLARVQREMRLAQSRLRQVLMLQSSPQQDKHLLQ